LGRTRRIPGDDVVATRRWDRPMIHPTDLAYWRDLETNAHLPEMQALIRQEILSGAIRVRPRPGGGILIMPVGMPESDGPRVMDPPPPPIFRRDEPTQGSGPVRRARSVHR
jgi:hypothetical protein